MYIDKNSKVPIYYQLKQIILDKIKSGEWAPDSPILSERELSEAFKISRMTIRQAMSELVNEGILYRERGKGTFVSQPKIEQSDVMSFTEIALSHGFEAETKINNFDVCFPIPNVSEKLNLSHDEKVYYIQRLRMINNKVIAVEDVYLPVKFMQNAESIDFTKSIYKLLKDNFDYDIDHVKASMEAVIPDEKEMKLFQVKRKIPILKVSAVHITTKKLKLYFEESLYRSDKFIFNINIYKR